MIRANNNESIRQDFIDEDLKVVKQCAEKVLENLKRQLSIIEDSDLLHSLSQKKSIVQQLLSQIAA